MPEKEAGRRRDAGNGKNERRQAGGEKKNSRKKGKEFGPWYTGDETRPDEMR